MAAPNNRPNGIMKLLNIVAASLIIVAILGSYAYTRDSRQEMRAETVRLETNVREQAKNLKTDIQREFEKISISLLRLENKVDAIKR